MLARLALERDALGGQVSHTKDPHTAGMLAFVDGAGASPAVREMFRAQVSLFEDSMGPAEARIKSALITAANTITVRSLLELGRRPPAPDEPIPGDFHVVLAFNNFLLGTLHFAANAEGHPSCLLEELVRDASTLILARSDAAEEEQATRDGYDFFREIRAQAGAAEDRWRNAVVQQCRGLVLQALSLDPKHAELDFRGALARLLAALLSTTAVGET